SLESEAMGLLPKLIPGESLAPIGGLATEDRRERALDPVLRVVAVLTRALDARDESLSLLIVVLVVSAFVLVDDRIVRIVPAFDALNTCASGSAFPRCGREGPFGAADR